MHIRNAALRRGLGQPVRARRSPSESGAGCTAVSVSRSSGTGCCVAVQRAGAGRQVTGQPKLKDAQRQGAPGVRWVLSLENCRGHVGFAHYRSDRGSNWSCLDKPIQSGDRQHFVGAVSRPDRRRAARTPRSVSLSRGMGVSRQSLVRCQSGAPNVCQRRELILSYSEWFIAWRIICET